MKKSLWGLFVLLMLCLAACSVAGGIFKAGAYTGIIAVVAVMIIVVLLFSMLRKSKTSGARNMDVLYDLARQRVKSKGLVN